MEEERQKKVEAGREKLAVYKKKKQKNSSASQSDTSLSLSPPLPGNVSDSSIISEHLNSNSDSIENDRSSQEIEISNVPSNCSLLLNLSSEENTDHISQEKPLQVSILSSNSSKDVDSKNNVQSILSEILKSEQFKSDSDHTLHQSDNESNDNSFNLFKDINLNDSIINEYSFKSPHVEERLDKNSLNYTNLSLPVSRRGDESVKVKHLEEIVNAKESTIAALSAELESLHELNSSNQSTPSLNTSTTDYKVYQDDFQTKIVEYQNALSHRDTIIQQLTEALKQSVSNREHLQEQSDYFSKEIVILQKQLAETSTLLGQRKCDTSDLDHKHDFLKSIKDNSIQTDSLPSQILQQEVKNGGKRDSVTDETKRKSNLSAEVQTSMVSFYSRDGDKSILNLDKECLMLEETLTQPQIPLMKEVKDSINACIESKLSEYRDMYELEFKKLEDKLESEKNIYESEIAQLREILDRIQCDPNDIVVLRKELEAKHAKEVEELRMYFEQKCADLEKQKNTHYSEEVFSQQSRKMSESSLCSETSDILFSGPGGDTGQIFGVSLKRHFQEFTKHDCIKLKNDLTNVIKDLNKYNLEEIKAEEHLNLLCDLQNHNLQSVFKFDLSVFKLEMQNKYHAELEILREDYENRIDILNVDHNSQIDNLEKKYIRQIDSLKFELGEALRNAELNVTSAVQEVASLEEFELAEVVQSYERRLQEQVTMAKVDIINALEHQIQMLVGNTIEDADWPSELLQIRNRFTEKYEKEIAQLKSDHESEVTKLKDEHFKILNGTVERAKRRNSKEITVLDSESDILRERDTLRKTTIMLRYLIGQLMKYFTECEDEVNKTIVDELLKQNLGKNLTELEVELNDETNLDTSWITFSKKKRVHFAPNFEDIISTINDTDANISLDLKNELEACLDRLRTEANAILHFSLNYNKNEQQETENETRIASLTRQLVTESNIKKDLGIELEEAKNFIKSLELERSHMESQIEHLINKQKVLEEDLNTAREKITRLIETEHKEIISKGYGGTINTESCSLGERIAILGELQDRARNMVVECASGADHPLLELVEELCREGSRISEEAKNEHEDLQQQIEAADKKLRATCRFLEEQAADREQERDEAQKEIILLREQIRDYDKERINYEQIGKEVEQLESQMREMSKVIEENDVKRNEVEVEKKEAIEKILVLREIIRDLESQVEAKIENETELKVVITQLENLLKQQNQVNEELNRQVSTVHNIKDAESFQQHIHQLEDEIQRLKLNTEFAGSEGALKQLKNQLNEIESNIDDRTRELEALHFALSTTTCSSPSEDMSVRDQIRPKSPSVLDECDLPLQQLARLKEKLIKHSRAEDAAIKRIHDLEMEIEGVKQDLNEVQNERDLLQDQVSEHLILISSLQMRLDDQRLRAEQVQKQTNTSLEVRIYDLENEIKNLLEVIATRDKTIKHSSKTIDEARKKLNDQEIELTSKLEDTIVLELQNKLKELKAENVALQQKINNDAQNVQVLPGLLDNILADKNKDIEKLQEKLDKTQLQLNEYLALNLDKDQLKVISQLSSSERAFSDILTMIDHDSPDVMRKVGKTNDSLSGSMSMPIKLNPNETAFMGYSGNFESEISKIEKVGKPNMHYSIPAPLAKPNSTEIQKSAEKHVHFEDSVFNVAIERLQQEILELKNELFERDELIKEYSERLDVLTSLEANVQKLQSKLEFTEKAMSDATVNFEKELNNVKEEKKTLKVDIAEKKMHLTNKEQELYLLQQDTVRKDQMYMNVLKEKRELEKVADSLKEEVAKYKECDNVIDENNKEIDMLKAKLEEVANSVEKITNLELELSLKRDEINNLGEQYDQKIQELNMKISTFQQEITEKDKMTVKLQKDLANKESQINLLTKEVNDLKVAIERKDEEISTVQGNVSSEKKKIAIEFESNIQKLKNLVIDRETEIEILNEDTQRYQDDISKLENQIKVLKKSVNHEYELKINKNIRDLAAKDLKVAKLTSEVDDLKMKISHMQEVLNEKDVILNQMSDDSKTLRLNLETIKNKIQESGNVLDLKQRLEDEKQLNTSLREQLNAVKFEEGDNKFIDMSTSIEEITGEVCKQIEYSAHLDSSILSALELGDIDENDVCLLKETLAKERKLNAELKNLNTSLQEKLQTLQLCLENEQRNCAVIQLEDANMLEQLRLRLEAALENETEFEKLLDAERQTRLNLEQYVVTLKQKLINLSSGENSKTEATEYKSLPTMQSLEFNRLCSEVKSLEMEVYKLQVDIKDMKTEKLKMNATLKYTKDMLEFKKVEIEKLEGRINSMKEVEAALKEKWMSAKAELEQKSRELENSRVLIGEMEVEERQTRDQLNKLNENFAKALDRESKLMNDIQSGQLKQTVPEKFLYKMKELNESVEKHIKENEQLRIIVENLNKERSKLQSRITELEELNHIKFPFDDPVVRANHLFAKYLRSESYRKALAWQKKYIVNLLASYQQYPSPDIYPFENMSARRKGKSRFRAAVVCVIAIVRMQFLVNRWHSGVREMMYHHCCTKPVRLVNPSPNYVPFVHTHFQVGQPVSSQNFPIPLVPPIDPNLNRSPVPSTSKQSGGSLRSSSSSDLYPWSGQTPPSKDYPGRHRGELTMRP
ncbi:hypothetical protein FQA39_LY08938 [Lamprigera yunnana]|nr:hypothetical protein FQA39_LY08938 [Lamprigera yunnana]